MKTENIKLFELNPSQEVVKLQCTYTLFKKVVNILTSATSNKKIDFSVMENAFNMAIERHDCTRLRFVKKNKKLMQYFLPKVTFENIPCISFNTKEEQDKFINNQSKKAIKFMKGSVIEPTFINTYDGKQMIFLKVCHLIFDIYGLNYFIKDLFDLYEHLTNNTPLPETPKKFEELLQKDLIIKHDENKIKRDFDYFEKLLSSNPEPIYAGFDGGTNKHIIKSRAKGKKPAKMFFIKNDTKLFAHSIEKPLCDKMIEYCKTAHTTIANLLLYIFSVTQSKLNGDVEYLLPLELCNVRDTLLAKRCSGTKVQSLNCLTKVDKNQSFADNLKAFVDRQSENYRHIGMEDMVGQVQLHRIYKTSIMTTYYSLTYSFIPYQKSKDVEINFYSNGKCALPAYVAVLYDFENNTMGIGYDCQTQLISKNNVSEFHENLKSCIKQVLNNPNILIKDIKLKDITNENKNRKRT